MYNVDLKLLDLRLLTEEVLHAVVMALAEELNQLEGVDRERAGRERLLNLRLQHLLRIGIAVLGLLLETGQPLPLVGHVKLAVPNLEGGTLEQRPEGDEQPAASRAIESCFGLPSRVRHDLEHCHGWDVRSPDEIAQYDSSP